MYAIEYTSNKMNKKKEYAVPDNLDGEKNTIPYYLISENNRG